MAIAATIYLGWLGPDGLAELGRQCAAKASYAAERLTQVPGVSLLHPDAPFFKEFALRVPGDAERVVKGLVEHGYLGGWPSRERGRTCSWSPSRSGGRGNRSTASSPRWKRWSHDGDRRPDPAPGAPGSGTILDRSVAGRRAWSLPALDVPEAPVPAEHARTQRPGMPEVGEVDLVRHYTRLAQMNYGLDTGMYPLGSCTMKYNPKVAETVAALPGFQRLHPLQPDTTTQGALELLWRLERALCEVTGMARATLQPPAGACGEMTGLLLMRAYHEDRGDARRRVDHPGLRTRDEPGERPSRRVRGGSGPRRTRADSSTWGHSPSSWTSRSRASC